MAEKGVARLTDIFVGVCVCHPPAPAIPMTGTIVTGSGNVETNGLGSARKGDTVLGVCGHIGLIVDGSDTVQIGGVGVARTGAAVVGCLIGTITSGSDTVVAG